MNETNYFRDLQSVDCSADIEKKGGLSYLSWPFAVAQLKARHPDAAWKVRHYRMPGDPDLSIPYCITPGGCFVCVEVTVNGITHEQVHPVLNNKNKTIPSPEAFDINTSIMRCLVKCIALHGLGLSIYAGEDLPMDLPESNEEVSAKVALWKNRIANTNRDTLKICKQEMAEAYGGSGSVPSVLIAAWNARKEELVREYEAQQAKAGKAGTEAAGDHD
jgi:hypothetical protein